MPADMIKDLSVSKQVGMGPEDRRWVPPLVVGAAHRLSPAAVAARLRETSWRPRGSLLRSDPSSGTRPHVQCWDTMEHTEMSKSGKGRYCPHVGPWQQERVTGQGCRIGSAAHPGALRLYSVLVPVPACRWGDMLYLFPGVALVSVPPTVGHRGVLGFLLSYCHQCVFWQNLEMNMFKCFLAFHQLYGQL